MKNITILFFLFVLISCKLETNNEELLLNTGWKFSRKDSMIYAAPNFNDSQWENISINKNWELQNYNDYDGVGWYRRKFFLPSFLKKGYPHGSFIFAAGVIDDNDEVFLNGSRIGSNNISYKAGIDEYVDGAKHYNLLSSTSRIYELDLNSDLIKWDHENVLAIRVYDAAGEGGLKTGVPMIYVSEKAPFYATKLLLNGKWKIHLGDSVSLTMKNYHESGWKDIKVANDWESQGYESYDGYAWYCQKFKMVTRESSRSTSVKFNLGYIDDNDEVYLNGYIIGRNGVTLNHKLDNSFNHDVSFSTVERIYEIKITDTRLLWDQDNIIAIRVFDSGGEGGMRNGIPYIEFADSQVFIDKSKLFTFEDQNLSDTVLVLRNSSSVEFLKGKVNIHASNSSSGKMVLNLTMPFFLKPNDSCRVPVSLPFTTDQTQLLITIKSENDKVLKKEVVVIPFILKN